MDVGDWMARSEGLPFLRFVPVDNRIAVRAALAVPPRRDDLVNESGSPLAHPAAATEALGLPSADA